MGVFSAPNAEELHAKLDKAAFPPIPVARMSALQDGKEADEARRKLKELGLAPARCFRRRSTE
jgi:hypothetical protein